MSDQPISEINPIECDILSESKNPVKLFYPKLSDVFQNLITHEEAEDLVKRALLPNTKFIDYHLQNYSEEKLGFLGSHLCLVVVYRQPGNRENETKSFVVKAVPHDVSLQAAYIQEKGCFRKEIDFFGLLVPSMIKNFSEESWLPKCHLAKGNVLLFEDLKICGFSNRSEWFDDTMKSIFY